jgi:hypothetical protein
MMFDLAAAAKHSPYVSPQHPIFPSSMYPSRKLFIYTPAGYPFAHPLPIHPRSEHEPATDRTPLPSTCGQVLSPQPVCALRRF